MKKIIAILALLISSYSYGQDTIRIRLGSNTDNSAAWSVKGNTNTNTEENHIGTNDSASLIFKTFGIESGNIDITNYNTSLGQYSLISKTGSSQNTAFGYKALFANTTGNNNTALGTNSGINSITGSQNTYIGWNTGQGITSGNYNTILGANVGGLPSDLSNNIIISDGQGNRRINVDSEGNVAIGINETMGYKLAVNGDAIFERVKVKLHGSWPDYVFHQDHKLPSLEEIESFIKYNKHLPELPSVDVVGKNGIDLSEIQILLLKKIEELTLYIIDQNKKTNQQQEQIDLLHHELTALKAATL